MAYSTRRKDIVRIVQLLRRVSVQELTQRLNVSEATVRKDLAFLEDEAILFRTHGGAALAEENRNMHNVRNRENTYLEEKRAIAQRARALVSEGETIFLDSGSTCAVIAAEIKDMSLRVIAHSVGVINELINADDGLALYSLGGSYRPGSGSFIGPLAQENLQRFRIETCFVGTAGFSTDGTFYAQNLIEAELKTEALRLSTRRVIVADYSKMSRTEFAVFARPRDFDILILGGHVNDQQRGELSRLDVEILFAGLDE